MTRREFIVAYVAFACAVVLQAVRAFVPKELHGPIRVATIAQKILEQRGCAPGQYEEACKDEELARIARSMLDNNVIPPDMCAVFAADAAVHLIAAVLALNSVDWPEAEREAKSAVASVEAALHSVFESMVLRESQAVDEATARLTPPTCQACGGTAKLNRVIDAFTTDSDRLRDGMACPNCGAKKESSR